MGQALEALKVENYSVDPTDLQHIWPTRFEHINVYGKYEFDLKETQKREGLHALRSPDDVNP